MAPLPLHSRIRKRSILMPPNSRIFPLLALALWRRLLLPRGCSADVCDRSPRAFQRLRSVDSSPQPRRRPEPLRHTGALVTHTAATAEGPLQGVQRYSQPRGRRSWLYPTAAVHNWYQSTTPPSALPMAKPLCSAGRDGADTANADQQRHSSLQQPLGLTSGDGQKEGRQSAFLRGFSTAQHVDHQRCTPSSPYGRPPRRITRGSLVFHSWSQEWILASPYHGANKEKTAFRTSGDQLFEFNQVPFGLCNAPATFSRLMDLVLAGLHWETCLLYLDDIIVFAATWEEHLARLRQVF